MIRAVALAVTFVLGAGSSGLADIYAVVVGIDDYAHETVLEGAVNDAEDIAAVLERRGAKVTLLRNSEADRSTIITSLRKAMSAAQPGDSVVFSYAGHGTQFPEALAGDETDGQDETYILADFQPTGEAARSRIRDNDLAAVLLEAKEGVGVLVIADSCHSGTMTRAPGSANTFGKRRWSPSSSLQEDPLPKPARTTYQLQEELLEGVVFASGARDNQTVIEMEIDGKKRGVLSWSMARLLEAGMDFSSNENVRETGLADVRAFVRAQVRQRTYAQQEADLSYSESFFADNANLAVQAIRELFNPSIEPIEPRYGSHVKPISVPLALAAEPEVYSLPQEGKIEASPVSANLVHDPKLNALFDRASGDLIGKPKSEVELQAAILAWRAVRGLAKWVPLRPAEPKLLEGDGRHLVGDKISIALIPPGGAPSMRHAILVNLAASGEVQYVFPSENAVRANADVIKARPETTLITKVPIISPVGTDNLIAVFSEQRNDSLISELRGLDGKLATEELLTALRQHASNPDKARVGMLTIFTAEKQ